MTTMDPGGEPGAQGAAGDGAQSPKEMLGAATGAVKHEAAAFAASIQDKTSQQVADRKDSAVETLGAFANAIRHAGDELAQQDQSVAGRVVKQAADGLEQLSRSVSEKRPEEMLGAVREFGRRNPTAFIAGSVLLGVALGRFARSSESHGGTSVTTPSQDFGQSVASLNRTPSGHSDRVAEPAPAGNLAGAGEI